MVPRSSASTAADASRSTSPASTSARLSRGQVLSGVRRSRRATGSSLCSAPPARLAGGTAGGRRLHHGMRVRLHLGTDEVDGALDLGRRACATLDDERLTGILRLDRPVAAAFGDRFRAAPTVSRGTPCRRARPRSAATSGRVAAARDGRVPPTASGLLRRLRSESAGSARWAARRPAVGPSGRTDRRGRPSASRIQIGFVEPAPFSWSRDCRRRGGPRRRACPDRRRSAGPASNDACRRPAPDCHRGSDRCAGRGRRDDRPFRGRRLVVRDGDRLVPGGRSDRSPEVEAAMAPTRDGPRGGLAASIVRCRARRRLPARCGPRAGGRRSHHAG